jgi:hypothetical protein
MDNKTTSVSKKNENEKQPPSHSSGGVNEKEENTRLCSKNQFIQVVNDQFFSDQTLDYRSSLSLSTNGLVQQKNKTIVYREKSRYPNIYRL